MESNHIIITSSNWLKRATSARVRFDDYKDLIRAYAIEGMTYREFAARIRRRQAGRNEDHDWPDKPERPG